LGWFRTISLPHVTHSENGCRGAYKHEFLPQKPFLRFSQRTCPIHYFRSKTHVWSGFAQFYCRTSPILKTGVGVHTKHEFLPMEPFLRFSQQACPIHYFRSKTHVWGGFTQFRCRTSHIPKMGVGVQTKHKFLPLEPFLRFSQRTCPIHYFRSKTHVWGGFAQFRCRTSPIPKTGVGVHTSTSFCHRNHFFVFRNEHAQSTTLGPKLMFGVVSLNFVATRPPFRKRVSGCIQARVFATGTISSFFAMNMANPLL
jgi:RNA polymerase subunit RPABC4/transcription elongation factor Spt4